MGAHNFQESHVGISMKEAFESAREDAQHEYGTDPYNGTISTVYSFVDRTAQFKASGKDIQQFINDSIDHIDRECCWGVCLEAATPNTNKIKSQVEHIVTKGTKQWELRYVGYNKHGETICSEKTKGAAVEKARAYVERNPIQSVNIHMEKHLVGGQTQVARVSSKSSANEKKGKYVFFGWARS